MARTLVAHLVHARQRWVPLLQRYTSHAHMKTQSDQFTGQVTGQKCSDNLTEERCNDTVTTTDDGLHIQECYWVEKGNVCMAHPCSPDIATVTYGGKKRPLAQSKEHEKDDFRDNVHAHDHGDGTYYLTCTCPPVYATSIGTKTSDLWDPDAGPAGQYKFENLWVAGGEKCNWKSPLYHRGVQYAPDPADGTTYYQDALKAHLCTGTPVSKCDTVTSVSDGTTELCIQKTVTDADGTTSQICAARVCDPNDGNDCIEPGSTSPFAPCGMGAGAGYLSVTAEPTFVTENTYPTATCACVQKDDDDLIPGTKVDVSTSGACTLSLCSTNKDGTLCGASGSCVTQQYQDEAYTPDKTVHWHDGVKEKLQKEFAKSYLGIHEDNYDRMDNWITTNEEALSHYNRLQYCKCDETNGTQAYNGVCQAQNHGCPVGDNGLTCSGGGTCDPVSGTCSCYINHVGPACTKITGTPYEQDQGSHCYWKGHYHSSAHEWDWWEQVDNCAPGTKPSWFGDPDTEGGYHTCSCVCDPDTIKKVVDCPPNPLFPTPTHCVEDPVTNKPLFPGGCAPLDNSPACSTTPGDKGSDCTNKNVWTCATFAETDKTCAQVPFTDPDNPSKISEVCEKGQCYLTQENCINSSTCTNPQA